MPYTAKHSITGHCMHPLVTFNCYENYTKMIKWPKHKFTFSGPFHKEIQHPVQPPEFSTLHI